MKTQHATGYDRDNHGNPAGSGVVPSQNKEPATSNQRTVVVRALHKSGSMFLYRFFGYVSRRAGWDYYSNNHQVADQNLGLRPLQQCRCVCPLRSFDQEALGDLQGQPNVYQIYHLRDPRDMIVSEYYSFGWTHPDDRFESSSKQWRREVQKMSIDEYVVQQPEFSSWPIERKFDSLMSVDESPFHVFVQYETMVTRFPLWVSQVLKPFPFLWPGYMRAVCRWKYRNEFQTDGKHKRSILPGDHRRQLKPETIECLNERYQSILTRFGYPMDVMV